MNYTEGEWIHKEDGVIMAGDYQVACVCPKDREANAHLIAAAPDSYEALKALLKSYEELTKRARLNMLVKGDEYLYKSGQEACIKTGRAIAKAEGK
jgi:hypothetical protein